MRNATVGGLLSVLVIGVPSSSRGQTPPASPCLADSLYRKFDFWIGTWDVTPRGNASVVGHSVVQRIAGGCGLLENWTAANGTEGKSINTYNTSVQQWQQYWVGQQIGGLTEYRESHWDGPTLVFLARSAPTAPPLLQRLSFTPSDSGTVRQFGEIGRAHV